jgi:tryptophan synthase alpha chain
LPEQPGFAATFARSRAEGRLALLPWVMAGYPSVDSTVELLLGLEAAGADGFELGVPFSDPIADGPTTQMANQVALAAGVNLPMVLELLAKARRGGLSAPVAIMGYANPFLRHGLERFCREAVAAGAQGLIVPDAPREEALGLSDEAFKAGLDLIQFVAPTSSAARIRAGAAAARGFVYVVSVTGVTGARVELASGLDDLLVRVRAATQTPVVVGFGISTTAHLTRLRGKADGAIVASALVNLMRDTESEPVVAATAFVRELAAAARGEGVPA